MASIEKFQNSGYSLSGASRMKKSMAGWVSTSLSPQEDIDYNLDTLRQRSRDLTMSAPIAVSALKNNRTNVVGSGLRLKSNINFARLGITEEQAVQYQTLFENEFDLWAASRYCDTLRLNNFYELQQVALMSWLQNGDAFAIPKYGKCHLFMPYALNIHLIEADRISTPGVYVQTGTAVIKKAKNGNRIYSGVEIDRNGAVVAYHICNTYPNSKDGYRKEWTRVAAFGEQTGSPNIIQLMESERCEQYRGIPYLAPVIESLKQITRYTEAELMAAVISSFFTVFIKVDGNRSENPMGESVSPMQQVATERDEPTYELGAGTVNVMGEGEEMQFANPARPISGFDMFLTAITTQIGAALEIPSEMLTKKFSASYSASRAAFLEAWKAFRMRRVWFAADFCQPIYEMFLAEAVSIGRIDAPGFFVDPILRKAWCGAEWNGPSQGQIDPVKEVDASILKCAHGFSTHQKETMELTGGDFAKNAAQLKRERELLPPPVTPQIAESQKGGTNQ